MDQPPPRNPNPKPPCGPLPKLTPEQLARQAEVIEAYARGEMPACREKQPHLFKKGFKP